MSFLDIGIIANIGYFLYGLGAILYEIVTGRRPHTGQSVMECLVNAAGEVRWVFDYTVPVRDEHGDVTHYAGYLLDITDWHTFDGPQDITFLLGW